MAITALYNTGFEHGLASAAGGGLGTITGAPTIVAGAARHGALGLRVNAPLNVQTYWTSPSLAFTQQKAVYRFAVKVTSLPASETQIAWGTSIFLLSVDASGVLRFTLQSGGTQAVGGIAINDGAWHLIELQIDSSANPWTANWRIDGTLQTAPGTAASAALNQTLINLGSLNANHAAFAADYDDLIVGLFTTTSDWFGDGEGVWLPAAADGVHTSTGTQITKGDASATGVTSATTDAYTMVDDAPPWTTVRSTTDNLAGRTASSGIAKLKVVADGSKPTANMVTFLLGYSATGTASDQAFASLKNPSGGEVSILGLSTARTASFASATNLFIRSGLALPGGGWTKANIDACELWFGTGTDVNPIPTVQMFAMEVDYPAAVAPINLSLTASAVAAPIAAVFNAAPGVVNAASAALSATALVFAPQFITPDVATASASATVSIQVPFPVILQDANAVASTASLKFQPILGALSASAVASTGTFVFQPSINSQAASAVATATGVVFNRGPGPVNANSAVASTGTLVFQPKLNLGAASASATATGFVTAPQFLALSASAVASATAVLTAAAVPRTTGPGRVRLSPVSAPEAGTQTLGIRARAASGSGILRVTLYDSDGTTIRGGPSDFTLTGSFQNFSLNPSGITNYSTLEIQFEGRNENGDPLTTEVSWVEFRLPQAGGAALVFGAANGVASATALVQAPQAIPAAPASAVATTGSLVFQPKLNLAPASAIASTGSLVFAPVLNFQPASAIATTGSLVFAPTLNFQAASAVASTGALVFQQILNLQSASAVASTGTLKFQPVIGAQAASAVASTGTLVFRPTINLQAASATASVGALAFQPWLNFQAASALASTSTLVFQPFITFQAASALASATANVTIPVVEATIPCSPASAAASATATLIVQPILPLSTSSAVASATATLIVRPIIAASAVNATATGALQLSAIVPLQAASSTASGSAIIARPETLALTASAVASTGTLVFQLGINFQAASAVASGTALLSRAEPISSSAASAVATTGSLAFRPFLNLQAASAVATGSAIVSRPERISLTASAVATVSANVTIPVVGLQLTFQATSAAASGASISLITGAPILAPAVQATASGTVQLVVRPIISATASAIASATLRLSSIVPLQAASAVATGTAVVSRTESLVFVPGTGIATASGVLKVRPLITASATAVSSATAVLVPLLFFSATVTASASGQVYIPVVEAQIVATAVSAALSTTLRLAPVITVATASAVATTTGQISRREPVPSFPNNATASATFSFTVAPRLTFNPFHATATGSWVFAPFGVTTEIVVAPITNKVSTITGPPEALFAWVAGVNFEEYVIKVVPASEATHFQGAPIPTAHGSVNMASVAGGFPANTVVNSKVNVLDLDAASPGDGRKIVKVYVRNAAGEWST